MKSRGTKIKLLSFPCSVVLCIFLLMVSACSDEGDISQEMPAGTGALVFSIVMDNESDDVTVRHARAFENCSDIQKVTASVFEENGTLIIESDTWKCADHRGRFEGIPAGGGRKLVVKGIHSEGTLLYEATKEGIIITENQITNVGEITAILVGPPELADQDGDGLPASDDCDDTDESTTTPRFWYKDADGDQHSNQERLEHCDRPDGYFMTTELKKLYGDCDDTDPAVNSEMNELCDNKDNNCDGSVDEELMQTTTCGVGSCAGNTGFETCTAGVWGNDTCDPLAGAIAETCNDIDDDCDGAVDDSLSHATTCGQGACANNTGTATCINGIWNDSCDPLSGATAETCNNIDDDCDGSPDNGLYCPCIDNETRTTSCGVGACISTGIETCNNGLYGGFGGDTCSTGTPSTETCNTIDDDCDGSVDEGLTQTTTCGVGSCAGNTGFEICIAGVWANDTCEPLAGASAETCNNVDDDCDGTVDEALTQATLCGTGACESTGTETCSAGVWGGDTCAAGTPTPETCNDVDDDCDGTVDETLVQATLCGTGACESTGTETCSAGVWGGDTCVAGTPTPETCNDVDDDCDGIIDDGLICDCKISGTIREGVVGVQGITVNLTGSASKTTETDAGGFYVFESLTPGNYYVTPSEYCSYFTPEFQQVSGGTLFEIEDVNFDAVIGPYEAKLTASDGAADDHFGSSVSISGDYAIVAAADGYNSVSSGRVYIFKRSGASWDLEKKLTADDDPADDLFGSSVSISGDYAIVGSYGDSAYIFKRSGSNWDQVDKLTANDGAAYDRFGCSVSISGDFAIVGAKYNESSGDMSGSAYIFKRNLYFSRWDQVDKLIPSDGAAYDYFGSSVSISGDFAIVGAHFDDDNGIMSGSAYMFKRSESNWDQIDKLTANDGATNNRFGSSVSISGDFVVSGAPSDDDNGSFSGSAYIFKNSGASWDQIDKLTASDGAAYDRFGSSVSISGDYAIVGAIEDGDNGDRSGSAYIFRHSVSSWDQVDKVTASDGAAYDYFGSSVSISGDYAIVGAEEDDDNGLNAGSVYVYDCISGR